MTSEVRLPFQMSLDEAACQRLPGVELHPVVMANGMRCELHVAFPRSHTKGHRQYPLLLVMESAVGFGAAVEMSRLMAETGELRECIVVSPIGKPPSDQIASIIEACKAQLPIDPREIALFGARVATPNVHILGMPTSSSAALPALVEGLRRFWSTGRAYGSNVVPMRLPAVRALLGMLRPLFALRARKRTAPLLSNPLRLRSERMTRDFEIFVTLPAGYSAGSARRYAALVVLDANIEFSTVAETAARMAAAGEVENLIVIGVGVPREEGHVEFGFRRFEEFSPPPAPSYRWSDDLGRIFRSLFALRGQDARERIGQAPTFFAFLTQELLPLLQRSLAIDERRLGLMGHSAGGTFVSWALHQSESPFSRYFAVSPGIGISDRWLMSQPPSQPLAARAEQVVLTVGSEEMGNAFNRIAGIHETPDFADRLGEQAPALDLHYRCFEGQTHSSVFPAAVAYSLATGYARRAEPAMSTTTAVAA